MMNNSYMDRYFSSNKQTNEEKRRFFDVDLFFTFSKSLSEGAATFLRYRGEK
jgi:hypothetical protein